MLFSDNTRETKPVNRCSTLKSHTPPVRTERCVKLVKLDKTEKSTIKFFPRLKLVRLVKPANGDTSLI